MSKFIHGFIAAAGLAFPLIPDAISAQEKESRAQKEVAEMKLWVETQTTLSKEKQDWAVERAAAQELLSVYQTEIELLREELQAGGDSVEMLNGQRAKLETEIQEIEQTRAEQKKVLVGLKSRVDSLLKKLPDPLKNQLIEEMATLKEKTPEKESRAYLLALVKVLREAERFNRSVAVAELVNIDDSGQKRNSEVLYLGLGRAFYLSGKESGIGVPSAEGWVWKKADDLNGEIEKAIAIYEKRENAALVDLPVAVEARKEGE